MSPLARPLLRRGLLAPVCPVVAGGVAGLLAAPLEEAALGRERDGEVGKAGQVAQQRVAQHGMAQRGWGDMAHPG